MSTAGEARHIYQNTSYAGLREYYICSRKKLFIWEDEARVEAINYGLDTYQCIYCAGWHMGHNSSGKIPKDPGEWQILRALMYGVRKEQKRRKRNAHKDGASPVND